MRARVRLTAAFLICSACRPNPPQDSSPEPIHCADKHVNQATCDALASSTFNPAPEGQLEFHCQAGGIGPQATVEWKGVEGDFYFRGVARFAKTPDGSSFAPADLEPIVTGWPCKDEACRRMTELPKGLTVTTPSVPACRDDVRREGKALTVTRPGPDTCVNPNLPRDWCTRKGAHEQYWWWERMTGGGTSGGHLEPNADPQAHDLFVRLSTSFWNAPEPEDKSCRDGNTWTIAGRKDGQWRVMTGSCQPIPFVMGKATEEPHRQVE